MHNLFLATVKRMFKLWTYSKLFSPSQLNEIEERIKSFEVPSDIGRLPMRITRNCGSYAAEQWKNWTLIYSNFCLQSILPEEHFRCGQTFVFVCRYILQVCYYKNRTWHCRRIDSSILQVSGDSIWKKCHYPKYAMHNHLKEVILDHGPVTSFWCFSFERFSGILGSITTNKRSVELQIMRKFILRFPKDIKLQFKGDFKFRSPDVSPSDWLTIYEFSYIATNVPLRGINLLNKSEISVSSLFLLIPMIWNYWPPSTKCCTLRGELKQVNSQKLYINLARLKSGYLRMGPKYKQEEYVLPRY